MTKLITIDYDEYLDLVEYKKILCGAVVNKYSLEMQSDPLDPMRRRVNQDIYNKELFDYLKKTDEVVCIQIWRGSDE